MPSFAAVVAGLVGWTVALLAVVGIGAGIVVLIDARSALPKAEHTLWGIQNGETVYAVGIALLADVVMLVAALRGALPILRDHQAAVRVYLDAEDRSEEGTRPGDPMTRRVQRIRSSPIYRRLRAARDGHKPSRYAIVENDDDVVGTIPPRA